MASAQSAFQKYSAAAFPHLQHPVGKGRPHPILEYHIPVVVAFAWTDASFGLFLPIFETSAVSHLPADALSFASDGASGKSAISRDTNQ
jgi:hypothetical protein